MPIDLTWPLTLPDPDALVPRAGSEQLPRIAPGDALHLILVAFERRRALELAGALVPDAGCRVEARRGQQVATRRPRDTTDSPRVGTVQNGFA